MQLTIDSSEPLERVLQVVGALYQVDLAVQAPAGAAAPAGSPAADAGVPTAADVGGGRWAGAGSGRRGAGTPPRHRPERGAAARPPPDMAAVRVWARDHGFTVADRGRVSGAVLDAYARRDR